ncbi:MAG TPA: hypothetical protein PKC99_07245 [Anaerolineales bacterium]|nr:hypothetical protein [Anaerolineales bacterium]
MKFIYTDRYFCYITVWVKPFSTRRRYLSDVCVGRILDGTNGKAHNAQKKDRPKENPGDFRP